MHSLTVAHNMASPKHNSMLTVACSQCHSATVSPDWTSKFGEYQVTSHASVNIDSKSHSIVIYVLSVIPCAISAT